MNQTKTLTLSISRLGVSLNDICITREETFLFLEMHLGRPLDRATSDIDFHVLVHHCFNNIDDLLDSLSWFVATDIDEIRYELDKRLKILKNLDKN